MVRRDSANSPVAVSRSNVLATETITGSLAQYDFTAAVALTRASVDSQGRRMMAMVTCDELCQTYEHTHTRKNHIQLFILQNNGFIRYEKLMDEPDIQDIAFKKDLLMVSQPDYYQLNPFDGVADLLGEITVFDVAATRDVNGLTTNAPFNIIKVLIGDAINLDSLSIGESMELRHRQMYGKSVYELFYHNWNFIQG